jgi:hypothetical protein
MWVDQLLKRGALTPKDIEGCQIFDFGELCGIGGPDRVAELDKLGLKDEYLTACKAFGEGFLNLPAPKCAFSISAPPFHEPSYFSKTLFTLAQPEIGDKITARPFIFVEGALGREYRVQRTIYFRDGTNAAEDERFDPGRGRPSGWIAPFVVGGKPPEPSAWYPAGVGEIHCEPGVLPDTEDMIGVDGPIWNTVYTWLYAMVLIAMGRLIADGVDRDVVTPPEKLNRVRVRKGHPAMVTHTVVKIKPYRAPMGHSGPRADDEYTPKRYHFRRGHVRRFQNGQKTWVRSCFVGDLGQGRIEHRYEVTA